MAELMTISGMVLSSMPMGEYDRRIVLLTPDRGKISGFARGARRPGNLMMAASQPFVYADFFAFFSLSFAERLAKAFFIPAMLNSFSPIIPFW